MEYAILMHYTVEEEVTEVATTEAPSRARTDEAGNDDDLDKGFKLWIPISVGIIIVAAVVVIISRRKKTNK